MNASFSAEYTLSLSLNELHVVTIAKSEFNITDHNGITWTDDENYTSG